jgi:hypothetical protein
VTGRADATGTRGVRRAAGSPRGRDPAGLATVTRIGVGAPFLLAGAGAFGAGFEPHVVLGRAFGR